MACCGLYTGWAVLTEPNTRLLDLGWNFPLNPLLIGVVGHLVLFGTGYVSSVLFGGHRPDDVERLTYHRLRRIREGDTA
jgi:SSS family solute:Na+ symporter